MNFIANDYLPYHSSPRSCAFLSRKSKGLSGFPAIKTHQFPYQLIESVNFAVTAKYSSFHLQDFTKIIREWRSCLPLFMANLLIVKLGKTRFLSDFVEKGWILKAVHRVETNSHCVEGWSWVRWLAVEGEIVETKLQPGYCAQSRAKFRFRFFLSKFEISTFSGEQSHFGFAFRMRDFFQLRFEFQFKKKRFRAALTLIEWRRWRRDERTWKWLSSSAQIQFIPAAIEMLLQLLWQLSGRGNGFRVDCIQTTRRSHWLRCDSSIAAPRSDWSARLGRTTRRATQTQLVEPAVQSLHGKGGLFDCSICKECSELVGGKDCLMWPNETENKTEPYNERRRAENNWTERRRVHRIEWQNRRDGKEEGV